MTLQPIVPARPRAQRAAPSWPMPTGPPAHPTSRRPSRPTSGPATTRSPPNYSIWPGSSSPHASPTVRAELGQFLADHGQHPSPASVPSSTAYSSAPHGTPTATGQPGPPQTVSDRLGGARWGRHGGSDWSRHSHAGAHRDTV